jgi:hypothetical protein
MNNVASFFLRNHGDYNVIFWIVGMTKCKENFVFRNENLMNVLFVVSCAECFTFIALFISLIVIRKSAFCQLMFRVNIKHVLNDLN